MDARRRAAAKVGTLARCATRQTLQLTQPNKTASLSRDWSAFVPIEAHAVLSLSATSTATAEARHKSAPVAHVRLDQCFPRACNDGIDSVCSPSTSSDAPAPRPSPLGRRRENSARKLPVTVRSRGLAIFLTTGASLALYRFSLKAKAMVRA